MDKSCKTISTPAPGITHFAATFSSIELYNQAVEGWNLEFAQLDRGLHKSRVDILKTNQALLNRVGFNQRVLQQGASPPGLMTFGVMTSTGLEFQWAGKTVTADTLEVFNNRNGFEMVSPRGFEAFTLALPTELLANLAERAQLDIDFRALENREGVIAAAPAYTAELRQLFTTALNPYSGYSDADRTKLVEQEAARLILEALSEKSRLILPAKSSSRMHSLQKAHDFIEANSGEPITVSRLCAVAHTSKRTLERAFSDYYGISPKQYINLKRLNGAHRDLIRASHHERITDIANRWGFWHMGNFAAEYRQRFGELPRQTLLQG